MNITPNVQLNNHFINQEQVNTNLKTFTETILSILENEISIPSWIRNNPNELWNPKNADLLDKITELDLRDLDLTAIPSEIGQLRSLKDLDLSNNEIHTLPHEMRQLTGLLQLSLNNTTLVDIPDVVYELAHLRGLYLSDNQISHIDKKMTNLKNLKWLHLNNNPINHIPPEVLSFFGNLKTLSLGNSFSNRMFDNQSSLSLMDKFI